MKKANDSSKEFIKSNLDLELDKSFESACMDPDFTSLVTRLKITGEVAKKYTSRLQDTVLELNNCKKCRSLLECKNQVEGCVSYPKVNDDRLRFDYVACKYKNRDLEDKMYSSNVFEEPEIIKNARMADIDLTDKKRAHVIKWVKKFYTDYQNKKDIKGCFLHGSFGSGKSFILAALLNELARKKVNTTIIYFPEMLRNLKESFNDDFDVKMEMLKKTDILLIDDIGAETVTGWSRDEILGTILQYRMDSKLPTLFTSNLKLDELETHLANTKDSIDMVKSRRIIERIKQLTDDLELVSENRRK
ncbi:MAG: primosomal protein DnaI [Erysipelotrichales bacterium]|nr:primosomal protein DnaI [Erysipelotrichales bacterium]